MYSYVDEIIKADDDLLFILEKRILEALKKRNVEEAKRKNRQYNALREEMVQVTYHVRRLGK